MKKVSSIELVKTGLILFFNVSNLQINKASEALNSLILLNTQMEYKVRHFSYESRAKRRLGFSFNEGCILRVVSLDEQNHNKILEPMNSLDISFFIKEEVLVFSFHKDKLYAIALLLKEMTGFESLPPNAIYEPEKLLINIIKGGHGDSGERKRNGIVDPNQFMLKFTKPVLRSDKHISTQNGDSFLSKFLSKWEALEKEKNGKISA